MADYVNCPTCHGRDLIPLADAEAITAHAEATAQAAQEQRRAREAAVLEARLAVAMKAADNRMAAIEAAVYGSTTTGDRL